MEEEKENEEINKGDELEQSVQDTQLPPLSPPHSIDTPVETIKIKDVVETLSQNINSLTIEDLTKILDQATQHAQICENPILVSVEELQKSVDNIKKGEVPPQEPP